MRKKTPEPLLASKNIAALIGAIAMTLLASALFSQVELLRQMGYMGIFLISLISSATIFLPLPGFAVVFAMGGYLNPILVGVAAGVGSGIGEISGYLAGFAGHGAVMRTGLYRSHKKQIGKYGPLAIFILAFIPNPVFDVAGIASGATKMPWWQFLLATAAGKTARYMLVAQLGLFASGWI